MAQHEVDIFRTWTLVDRKDFPRGLINAYAFILLGCVVKLWVDRSA